MFFGNKKLDEKKAQILELENLQKTLQSKIDHLESMNQTLQFEKEEGLRKLKELEDKLRVQQSNDETKSRELQNTIKQAEVLQNQIAEKSGELQKQRDTIDAKSSENNRLQKQINEYTTMSPEQFLKLGTEIFTLGVLTQILEKAQSNAFILDQREQQKHVIQKLINQIQLMLCPIRTDKDLMSLFAILDREEEADQIINKLNSVSLDEIVNSLSVKLK